MRIEFVAADKAAAPKGGATTYTAREGRITYREGQPCLLYTSPSPRD